MKKTFLSLLLLIFSLCATAQKVSESPKSDFFNRFKYVWISTEKIEQDNPWSWQVVEQLVESFKKLGIITFQGKTIPNEAANNPCSIAFCIPNHQIRFGDADILSLTIKDCKNDVLYTHIASALAFSHNAETKAVTKNAFYHLTKNIKYEYNVGNNNTFLTDLNPIKSGWIPLIDWDNQLFPSWIISTATANLPNDFRPKDYLGDQVSVLGIKVFCPNENSKVRIEIEDAENKFFRKVNQEFTLPKKGKTYVIYPQILWKYDLLKNQNQTAPIGLVFKVSINNQNGEEKIVNARLRSINDCPLTARGYDGQGVDLRTMFSAYVNEEHPEIDNILRDALNTKIVKNFKGYQGGSPEIILKDVKNEVFSIWRVLQDRGFKYSNITGGIGGTEGVFSQPVRLFGDAMKTKQANCIDGTAVFASILKKLDIDPFIVIIPGHAFLGFYGLPKTIQNSEGKTVELNHEQRQPQYLETTLIGETDLSRFTTWDSKNEASKSSFENALLRGENTYLRSQKSAETNPESYIFVSISDARKIFKPLGR